MIWREKLKLAWDNRAQIADGFWNVYIGCKPEIEAEALRRKTICESNVCGSYDKDGKPETSMIPGQPACSICHCNINAKAACTFCWCALLDKQILKLKELRPETNIQDIDSCRVQIKELQEQGIDMGLDPLWDVMMTKDQDDLIKSKEYTEQFKNR